MENNNTLSEREKDLVLELAKTGIEVRTGIHKLRLLFLKIADAERNTSYYSASQDIHSKCDNIDFLVRVICERYDKELK